MKCTLLTNLRITAKKFPENMRKMLVQKDEILRQLTRNISQFAKAVVAPFAMKKNSDIDLTNRKISTM